MAPAPKRQKTDGGSSRSSNFKNNKNKAKPIKGNKTQMDELKFDPDARQDYLTGFHKRKVQRIKHAQEQAAKMMKEEQVVNRRELREERKRDLERHVTEVNALLRQNNPDISDDEEHAETGEDGEWGGIGETGDVVPPVDGVDEYVDEDKYTTVTIETMSDDPRKWNGDEEEAVTVVKEGEGEEEQGDDAKGKKRVWTKEKPKKTAGEKKKKQQKFRYESKFERQQTRTKQRAKNRAAADARKAKD